VRIFVYEHITGGGCTGDALPQALLPEALLMLRALTADLRAIPQTEVVGLCDARIAGALGSGEQRMVADRAAWNSGFDALVRESDATWLIAPETAGVLEQLSARVLAHGKPLLGSHPHAVAIAASKLATASALHRAGVAVVPTWRLGEVEIAGPCVVKPDDGCGCEQTRRFPLPSAARNWISMQAMKDRFVVQPYVIGVPVSLSVLVDRERTALLSVNRQCIEMNGDDFSFAGCVVNAMADTDGKFARLAEQTVAAISGLWGYVGIDVLLAQGGPAVLEVNPRLTTSYAGLHAALGVNPARLVLGLLGQGEDVTLPAPGGRAVEVNLKQGNI
jgi:predicted ATP-grasp superfamily ATP-dependent carboligase